MYNTTWPHLFWKIFVDFLTSTLMHRQNTMLLSKERRRFFSNFVAFSENSNFIIKTLLVKKNILKLSLSRLKYFLINDSDSLRLWVLFRNPRFPGYICYALSHTNVFLLFFSRVSLTLSCPMALDLFPLDTQICHLKVASCK